MSWRGSRVLCARAVAVRGGRRTQMQDNCGRCHGGEGWGCSKSQWEKDITEGVPEGFLEEVTSRLRLERRGEEGGWSHGPCERQQGRRGRRRPPAAFWHLFAHLSFLGWKPPPQGWQRDCNSQHKTCFPIGGACGTSKPPLSFPCEDHSPDHLGWV